MPTCYQINLQTSLGGGEIYTQFFCRALAELGWKTEILISPAAAFWRGMDLAGAKLRTIAGASGIPEALPSGRALVLTHNKVDGELLSTLAGRHTLTGIAHMPYYERDPGSFAKYERVFAVSRHVRDSLIVGGLTNVHEEPLYGVAELTPRPGSMGHGVRRGPLYDWDRRKLRDRVLGTLAPMLGALRPRTAFAKRPGITLGVVSRLTPIKQFPLMFSILAPVLERHRGINLEIFGSGGYASVRDLWRALAIVGSRVRFWGYQSDVRAVYPQLDYVLSGLPEKEALGLNLIEAQACGTPVLAVNAPPFTETVLDGATGHLFEDPRRDGGTDFGRLLERLLAGAKRLQPQAAQDHLARFSREAFRLRVAAALAAVPVS